MKKLYLLIIMMVTIFMFQTGCVSNEPSSANEKVNSQKKKSDKNLNLSIFLDLSDRIDLKKYPNQTMEIYQRDLGYIKSLGEAFQEHLSNSRISGMDDQIQLFFEPEPKDAQINDLAKQMRFVFNKATVTPKAISSVTPTYVSCSNKIYQIALKENKYIGADIWTFFKNKVKDQCIKSNHRNILVILTDGYMFHQDNKLKVKNQTSYLTPELIKDFKLNTTDFANNMESKRIGFLPATSGLQDLKVLVIGINPQKGKNFEEDVIKKYWGDWLKKMGVQDYEIKGIDLPTYMDIIIKKAVLTK
ncbi:hypothetical protein [Pedobacter montanisoli]|uniref:VWFA domain-containing protein n=1 Tax=Pedobacter montanisoli TaxID=2923277 RepID=A0ABS9ZUF2_9SPHI|nr:hypothetical protein [Pedobacter montanisoli]MCJ0742220.1 hypothetical protein [Pedobacter montanisoli]